jgi:hypothetical protein
MLTQLFALVNKTGKSVTLRCKVEILKTNDKKNDSNIEGWRRLFFEEYTLQLTANQQLPVGANSQLLKGSRVIQFGLFCLRPVQV